MKNGGAFNIFCIDIFVKSNRRDMLQVASSPISIISRRIVLSFGAIFWLAGCAYDGAGYLKPEYNYISKPDDPEFIEAVEKALASPPLASTP